MLQTLSAIRHKCAIGFVGGSDLAKQQEQLGTSQLPVTALFDFCFAENGLTAYRLGEQLASQSFVGWLGEERYKELVNFVLRYLADVDCPVKRGTFVEFRYVCCKKNYCCCIHVHMYNMWTCNSLTHSYPKKNTFLKLSWEKGREKKISYVTLFCCKRPPRGRGRGRLILSYNLHDFRNGMVNISPVGRNASVQERNEYEKYDAQHQIRVKFVDALKKKFPDFGLT